MEKIFIFLMLLIWICASLLLVCSVIGMFLFIPSDTGDERSSWMKIGATLTESLVQPF